MAINVDIGAKVSSTPHRDVKNLSVGLCCIVVFGEPTRCFAPLIALSDLKVAPGFFTPNEEVWLLCSEAKILVQIPAGVAFLFPSAPLIHQNKPCKRKELIVVSPVPC